MSSKNLSRTVIEGGRASSNKWARRNSHKSEKVSTRDFCLKVKNDPELFFELDIKKKTKVGKGFSDKLGPFYRWLDSQLGNSWDSIYSQVSKSFDTRTTAGRHIVYDHLLNSVDSTSRLIFRSSYNDSTLEANQSYYRYDYYIDENGLLCKKEYVPRSIQTFNFDLKKILNWLNGRIVGYVGDQLYWFIPADKNKKRGGTSRKWKLIGDINYYGSYFAFQCLKSAPNYKTDSLGFPIKRDGKYVVDGYKESWVSGFPSLKQHHHLSNDEMLFWNNIPKFIRVRISNLSPLVRK